MIDLWKKLMRFKWINPEEFSRRDVRHCIRDITGEQADQLLDWAHKQGLIVEIEDSHLGPRQQRVRHFYLIRDEGKLIRRAWMDMDWNKNLEKWKREEALKARLAK